jgi:hypothetical protein
LLIEEHKMRILIALIISIFGATSASAQYDNPPSTNWWATERFCHKGHIDVQNIDAEVRGSNCDIPIIKKTLNGVLIVFADAVIDGSAGIPVAGDDVAVVIVGHNDADVVYLYGITSAGHVVIAFPLREQAQGRRTADYRGQNQVFVSDPDSHAGRLYCWNGSDWLQGLDANSCDMTHHARLVRLREPGQPVSVIREDYYGLTPAR